MHEKRDLYDALCVPPDATHEEIKKAYRKKAQKLHPDKGGKVDEFFAIEKAYRVLGDDERRKGYDETGDEGSARSREDKVLSQLIEGFLGLIESIDDEMLPKLDLIKAMHIKIDGTIEANEKSGSELRSKINKLTRTEKRIKKKRGSNFLAIGLKTKAGLYKTALQKVNEQIEDLQAMKVLLDDFTCAREPEPTSPARVLLNTGILRTNGY